jgi:hypothetical protein
MPQDRRSTPVLQELFADRQVYVRSGLTSRYVALSRSLQISVAVAAGVVVLWLAAASYAAIAKHLETVEQGRELARLESVAKTLRTTVEESRTGQDTEPKAAAVPDLVAELADAKAARERALTLADARAGEAEELRHELALAHDQIRELTTEATQAEAAQGAGFQIARAAAAPVSDPKLALSGLSLPDPGCPAPTATRAPKS